MSTDAKQLSVDSRIIQSQLDDMASKAESLKELLSSTDFLHRDVYIGFLVEWLEEDIKSIKKRILCLEGIR